MLSTLNNLGNQYRNFPKIKQKKNWENKLEGILQK